MHGGQDALIQLTGDVWDTWIRAGEDRKHALHSLWNEYLSGHWSNWTLADCQDVGMQTASNNPQESWHKGKSQLKYN